MNELYQYPERTKRALIRAGRVLRLCRSTMYVLQELVDNPSSRYWSNERLAASIGFSSRSVETALAQLRAFGFLTMKYRRKATAVKCLCAEAILKAVEAGIAVKKRVCEAAKALGAKASFLVRSSTRKISRKDINRGLVHVASIAKPEKSDASPYLLRAVGLQSRPKGL